MSISSRVRPFSQPPKIRTLLKEHIVTHHELVEVIAEIGDPASAEPDLDRVAAGDSSP